MKTEKLYFEKLLIVCMILILGLIISACATANFNQRSYQILKTSQATFNLVKDSVSELQQQGIVSKTEYNRIKAMTIIYTDAHNGAIAAITAYKKGLLSPDDANAKIIAASSALTELLKVAQPYIFKLDKGGE